jgi:sigma-B regulation protein RsbU (phosphoserine phosphatase)
MLYRLNKNLFARAPDGQFVALTYSTWDDERLLLEVCSSGLPEPLLLRNGSVYSLPIHGLPLGLFPETSYEPTTVQCKPGDALLFYTDGIVEACNADGKEFGTARLAEVILAHAGSSAKEMVREVVKEIAAHTQSESNVDDQTVVALKVLESPTRSSL